MKYYIKTFGCQQNKADSERIASSFKARGMSPARGYTDADYAVVNTCMVKRSAEDRVYGLVINLGLLKEKKRKKHKKFKIILTGCMVGLAFRDKTGQYLASLRTRMPQVDEFMPIEEVGFDNQPVRQDHENGWVPISNGCNNFCTFCVVPFTRGREISRPYDDIIQECMHLKLKGYKNVTLLGQNVNSYGADLLVGENNIQVMRDIDKTYFLKGDTKKGFPTRAQSKETLDTHFSRALHPTGHPSDSSKKDIGAFPEASTGGNEFSGRPRQKKPIFVKHLGRYRIPTLFPHLLEEVAQMGFERVDFMSSNPWDFSDELIEVIARNKNISRTIHLPVQSGDPEVLRRMNRWYSPDDYLRLVDKLKKSIPEIKFTTDIIVGFCGETDDQFQNTVALSKKVGFEKMYISMYSVRPMTAATKVMEDDVPYEVKRNRWQILENLVNKPNLQKIKKH